MGARGPQPQGRELLGNLRLAPEEIQWLKAQGRPASKTISALIRAEMEREMTDTTERIGGIAAIRFASAFGLRLSKYNDPVSPACDNLRPSQAHEIAREDASLIYADLDAEHAAAYRMILALCDEAGETGEPADLIEGLTANHHPGDILAAANGDVASLAAMRRACGLPIIV